MGTLDGLLVISLEQAVAIPFASSRLADAGARVIKVERLEGDFARQYDHVVKGDSAYFVWLNRGKESICMDLRDANEIALVKNMISEADVFLQNLKPGAASRLGLDPQKLREEHPKLITCSLSGYGSQGEWAAMKAYDLLIQAETGLTSITGSPDQPDRVGISVVDIAAGMYAWSAILEALIARGINGKGQHIEVSLFDAWADWMAVPLLWNDYGGKAPSRVGLAHPSICPYGAFSTSDGKTLLLSIQNEREWQQLCTIFLEDEAFSDSFPNNISQVKNREIVDQKVSETFKTLTSEDAVSRLKKADIAFATLNDVSDLSKHPVLRRANTNSQGNSIQIPAPPSIINNCPVSYLNPVPELNQHGDQIRAEFALLNPN